MKRRFKGYTFNYYPTTLEHVFVAVLLALVFVNGISFVLWAIERIQDAS